MAGTNFNCACTCGDSNCPTPPNTHFETTGNANGSYCFSAEPYVQTNPGIWTLNYWGNDGPPDCGAPTTLIDFSVEHSLTLDVAIQLDVIIVRVRIFGSTNFGGQVPLFYGKQNFTNCNGPWVLGNELSPGCEYVPTGGGADPDVPQFVKATHGGSVTVFPCGC